MFENFIIEVKSGIISPILNTSINVENSNKKVYKVVFPNSLLYFLVYLTLE